MAARAQVIDELEPVLPVWLVKRHPDCFPPHIFILKASCCRTALLGINARLSALLCLTFEGFRLLSRLLEQRAALSACICFFILNSPCHLLRLQSGASNTPCAQLSQKCN